jgi:hypothetical protein
MANSVVTQVADITWAETGVQGVELHKRSGEVVTAKPPLNPATRMSQLCFCASSASVHATLSQDMYSNRELDLLWPYVLRISYYLSPAFYRVKLFQQVLQVCQC